MRGEQRKCRHCGESFIPDARNAHHQRYCTAPSCRAASKRASQAKWLATPENRDYYRGPEAVARVQAWREAHPGFYNRRNASLTARAATDHAAASPIPLTPAPTPVAAPAGSPSQISCNASEADPRPPLQDLLAHL